MRTAPHVSSRVHFTNPYVMANVGVSEHKKLHDDNDCCVTKLHPYLGDLLIS